jgi:hypothetical protein
MVAYVCKTYTGPIQIPACTNYTDLKVDSDPL